MRTARHPTQEFCVDRLSLLRRSDPSRPTDAPIAKNWSHGTARSFSSFVPRFTVAHGVTTDLRKSQKRRQSLRQEHDVPCAGRAFDQCIKLDRLQTAAGGLPRIKHTQREMNRTAHAHAGHSGRPKLGNVDRVWRGHRARRFRCDATAFFPHSKEEWKDTVEAEELIEQAAARVAKPRRTKGSPR